MSGTYLTWLADELRKAGCKVVEYSGWQTRARSSGGYSAGRPWIVMWHHTASSTSPQNDANYCCNGSPDRPICTLLIARDGAVWILAAGCTNTNGKGNAKAVSKGTIPANSMNSYAVGIEIANNGVGEQYPQAQIDAAFAASIAILKRCGLQPTDVGVHEWYAPGRKIDPATTNVAGPWRPRAWNSSGTWDLDDLWSEHRRRWGSAPTPTPPPPDQEDDDMLLRQLVTCTVGSKTSPYLAVWNDGTKTIIPSASLDEWQTYMRQIGATDGQVKVIKINADQCRAFGPIKAYETIGQPQSWDVYGVPK